MKSWIANLSVESVWTAVARSSRHLADRVGKIGGGVGLGDGVAWVGGNRMLPEWEP